MRLTEKQEIVVRVPAVEWDVAGKHGGVRKSSLCIIS